MATFRSQRVTRSSVGSNGLDENFCGRTLRNRSIVHPDDSSPFPQLRSRSPKKKQDAVPQQKGINGGKVAECKQHNARESWASPRKRGLSCSEKDNHEKKPLDVCDPILPVFKRVKRCSRSEPADGPEDASLLVKTEKASLERKSSAANNDGDLSQLKRARRFLLLDDCDKREIKKVKDLDGGRDDSPLLKEVPTHQAANGINEKDAAAALECSDCEPLDLNSKPKCVDVDTCASILPTETENSNSGGRSLLLNGSKVATVSEPDVPSTDSEWEDDRTISDCHSVSQQSTTILATENPLQIRESEEEVDVVGYSLFQPKEQCFENASCSIDAARDVEQISGVPDSSAVLDSGLGPLLEPQEHSYQRLLQTIAVLEAQRAQAIQDLECLSRHQKEGLKEPITFVENLQQKVDMGFPCPQRVVQLPQIPWDHYTSGLGNFEKEYRNKKHNTRRLKLVFDKVFSAGPGLPVRPKSPMDSKKDAESSSSSFYSSMLPSSDAPEVMINSRAQVIRGRICDDSKSETFNQLWSVEEQKRLEELLLKYPPEEVETRRWQKIADKLGNRTAKQVASRVQKYFIKLAKAGIPIPGRTPNLYLHSKKSSNRRQHPLNKHLFRPSTFMTSHEPPVYMDDEDDRSSFYSSQLDAAADEEVSDDESIPPSYRHTAEYKELMCLKKLKKQKLELMQAESSFVQHIGFKCDNCGTEPILGLRWHCQDCPPDSSVDFCDSCSDCLYETEIHKGDHQLDPIYRVETFLDRDYCMSQDTSYNYLDPNYFPANR
ncbi:ZZ-type zinc finger-containing protein 3 isoform X3 [Cetorhinus maximus]